MGKCEKCGRDIDDRYKTCWNCKPKEEKDAANAKTASIERQTACKCTAQVFMGAGFKYATDGIQEKDIVSCFNIFLKLIRGA